MNNITNFNEQEITLEDSTKLFYVNKSKFLYKKAKRELGINNDEEIDEWLLNEPYVKNNVWNMDEFQMVPVKLLPKQ